MSKDTDRCVIYATGHRAPDQHPRCYVPVFDRADEARAWLMKFLAGREHTFEDDDTIVIETDFTIRLRSQQWKQIMAAPVANEEVRADIAQLILRFKYGSWDETHVRAVTPEVDEEQRDGTGGAIIAKRAPKPERASKAQVPDGYVTISQLCATSGMPAMNARAALRASGRQKPPFGWAFSPQEVPDIKKLCGMK